MTIIEPFFSVLSIIYLHARMLSFCRPYRNLCCTRAITHWEGGNMTKESVKNVCHRWAVPEAT